MAIPNRRKDCHPKTINLIQPNYTVSQKKTLDVARYNFNAHQLIMTTSI